MTHTALPPTSSATEEVGTPAAARWHRDDSGKWLVRVRRSMHRPGRSANVRNSTSTKAVVLGDIVANLDDVFVLSEFIDKTPKPPIGKAGQASEEQREFLRDLWSQRGGGKFVNTGRHILDEPCWDTLTAADARWYIDALKGGESR